MKASLVLASVLLASFATAVSAQTLTQAPPSQQAVTPAEMDRRLEQQAAATKRIAPQAARRVAQVGSVIVAAAGLWWFIERGFLSS